MKKICVTGAYGFIGKQICEFLADSNISVTGFVRDLNLSKNSSNIDYIPVGDIGLKTNLKSNLIGTDCIIHCAGRAHVMNETKVDSLKIYHSANVDGTKQLAEQAVEAGVKRFIFLSSIKVNGEDTNNKHVDTGNNNPKKYVFTQNDEPNPEDPYSISKFQAEKKLWEISARTGLEVVIVRMPLVYGYGEKGNLLRLMKLINSGIPLPFSLINNKRSLIGIDNLINLLNCCIDHPNAIGKTFLVSDGKDLSTPDLIKLIASLIGRKAYLFPVPLFLLKFLSFIFGKQKEISRLIGSLRVDNSYTKKILNWTPPISVEEGIRRMIKGK